MSSVAQQFLTLRAKIDAACDRAQRPRESVELVGASKRQPIEKLAEAWEAGLRTFGENRVQEVIVKAPQMPAEVDWHLIGPLQSNKVNRAVEHFSTIHSIDRAKIARAIDRAAGARGCRIAGLLQVNIGREESKHGFDPEDLLEAIAPLVDLEHLRIEGIMAIPPYEADHERARDWFRALRELRDSVFERTEWSGRLGLLSMGMSHDFDIAVEEGATHVRVGTALFGERD